MLASGSVCGSAEGSGVGSAAGASAGASGGSDAGSGSFCDFGGLLVGCVAGPVVKQLMDEHSAADDQEGRQSKRQDKAHSFHDSLISVR